MFARYPTARPGFRKFALMSDPNWPGTALGHPTPAFRRSGASSDFSATGRRDNESRCSIFARFLSVAPRRHVLFQPLAALFANSPKHCAHPCFCDVQMLADLLLTDSTLQSSITKRCLRRSIARSSFCSKFGVFTTATISLFVPAGRATAGSEVSLSIMTPFSSQSRSRLFP